MTIIEKYEAIISKCENVLTEDELGFLRERAELHEKQNTNRKPTKMQEENKRIKETILNFMEQGKTYSTTEIQKGIGLDSNQKVSALMRQLRDAGAVERSEIKGRAHFIKN